MPPFEDFYAILGVLPTVDGAELRRAYRELARRHHPDVAGEQATQLFQRIAEAFQVLSDPLTRAHYDDRLHQARSQARSGRHTVSQARRPFSSSGGEFEGPGGRFTWQKTSPRSRSALPLLARVSGSLDAMLREGLAIRAQDGCIELLLHRNEASTGGLITIDTTASIGCPTCLGTARADHVWCRRCEFAGTIHDAITVCVAIPANTQNGARFSVAVDPLEVAPPFRVRVRV